MRNLILFLMFLFCIPAISFAQCGCGDGDCSSSCFCGCQAPENQPPAFRRGNLGGANGIEFLSQVTLPQMGVTGGGVLANDCWGWVDPVSRRELAIIGLTDRTVFIEVTNPNVPVVKGWLMGAGGNEAWRDMKVYKGFVYIVADGGSNSSHGVQVLGLAQVLRTTTPKAFTADARYTGLGQAHNIAINEKTGFAYVIGSSGQNSAGGLIILDLKLGKMPVLHSVYSGDGYTHDTQVVNYTGPDSTYANKEIAFCSNEDTLTVVNVSKNLAQPTLISRRGYTGARYSHQGWLSPDQRYFFMNDELDELQIGPFPTRTHVWNVADLDNPVHLGFYSGTESTIDHNLYVKKNYIFQANYTSGLRVLKINNAATLDIQEVGFFDTYGPDNNVSFNGAWSCFPYFDSNTVIVSDRQNGLVVVRFNPF